VVSLSEKSVVSPASFGLSDKYRGVRTFTLEDHDLPVRTMEGN
jgi:hypothetical protein